MKDEVSKIGDGFTREGYPIDFHIEMAKNGQPLYGQFRRKPQRQRVEGHRLFDCQIPVHQGQRTESENEIAISTKIAEYFGISVGDTITGNLQEETRTFIVTGLFQSMSNLGMTARLSEDYPLTLSGFSSIGIYGEFRDPEVDAEKAKEVLTKPFPDTSISTRTDIYNNYLGSTVKSVDSMKNLIVGVVLGIIFLITCLIVRMLIAREVPEIALLKSIGFRDSRLRRWQIGRIVIVLVTSIVIGTILAGTIGSSLVAGVFSMMGATSVPLIIVPLQVYVLYPALLLVSTTLAAAVSIGLIRKTQIWEINCQE
jgi:putative ABC transport system permease protein